MVGCGSCWVVVTNWYLQLSVPSISEPVYFCSSGSCFELLPYTPRLVFVEEWVGCEPFVKVFHLCSRQFLLLQFQEGHRD